MNGNIDERNRLRGRISMPDVIHGKSAYEIAVMNGFEGTEEEWLDFLSEEATKKAEVFAEETKKNAEETERFTDEAEEFAEDAKNSAEIASAARDEAIAHTGEKIHEWLDEHPEATTTVQYDSLTQRHFSENLRLRTIKDYVTPQLYMNIGYTFTESLQMALLHHLCVIIPAGEYTVDDTIIIPQNITLRGCGSGNTKLKFTKNIDCFTLDNGSILEDLSISFDDAVEFDHSAIAIRETNVIISNVRVSNVVIRNRFTKKDGVSCGIGTGKGIEITATGNSHLIGICFGVLENVTVWNMEYGLYIEDAQHIKNESTGRYGGWVNSMRAAHCSFISCAVGIHIDSPRSAGHIFDFMYQSDPNTRYAIECSGRENLFRCYCWDIRDFEGAKLAHFTSESAFNKLQMGNSPGFIAFIEDEGLRNEMPKFEAFEIDYPKAEYMCRISNDGSHGAEYSPRLMGDQNNCLAFADKVANVTVTGSTDESTRFKVKDLFDSFNRPAYTDTTRFLPVVDSETQKITTPACGTITIDYQSYDKALIRLSRVGVVFAYGHIAQTITIKVHYSKKTKPTEDTEWTSEEFTVVNNKSSVVEFDIAELITAGMSVKCIELSFADALYLESYNPNSYISISNIYGVQNVKNNNTPFLPKCGGDMYGDVTFKEGGVTLTSPNGTKYRVTVDDEGKLSSTIVT